MFSRFALAGVVGDTKFSSPFPNPLSSAFSHGTEGCQLAGRATNGVTILYNHCSHDNTTMRAIYIVELHVVLNNVEKVIVVTEKQQWFSFVLLSSYKPFHTSANNIFFHKSAQTGRYCWPNLITKCGILWNKIRSSPCMRNLKKIRSKLPWYTPTDGRTNITKQIDTFRYLFEIRLNIVQISTNHCMYSIFNKTPPVGSKSSHYRGYTNTRRHTTLVTDLWTSDHVDEETSTWQHTITQQTDIHTAGEIQTHNPNKLVAKERHPHRAATRTGYCISCGYKLQSAVTEGRKVLNCTTVTKCWRWGVGWLVYCFAACSRVLLEKKTYFQPGK